jgi:putative transposase
MGWKLRLSGESLYHHVYAWGNDRHPVFKAEENYQKYQDLLEKHSLSSQIDVIAYALMRSHVHLFIYDRLNNLSDYIMKLHGDYARYYNKVHQRVGHVFGERFNNKIVPADIYGKWLSRYIHRQALTAGFVDDPVDYPWSSYSFYVGNEKKEFVKPEVILSQFGEVEVRQREYRNFVLSCDDGPVDWSKRILTLLAGDDLIRYMPQKLNTDVSMLRNPHGERERCLRHDAIRILHAAYGYKPALLARAFGLSRAAVAKILRK